MGKKKSVIPQLIVILASVVAVVLAIFLSGLSMSEDGITASVSLFGVIFGGGTMEQSYGNESFSSDYTGGLSYFGLVSFILLALGVIVLLVSLFKQGKLDILGYVLIILAGICIFLLKVKGTDVTISAIEEGASPMAPIPFKDVFEDFDLGAGVFVYGILAILGGLFGFGSKLLKK